MTTRAVVALALLALAGAACQAPRTPASSTAAAPAGPAAPTPAGHELRWFENEPEAAFAAATERGQLVFVDLWAPWCHTCLSMQQQVLRRDQVPELGNVVPLAVDTERVENEQFLRAHPVGVWPTFYVIDPLTKQVRARWLGGATAEQLSRFLKDASATDDGPGALLREASALAAQKRFAPAEAKYREALAAAPASWPRRADTLVALISSLLKQRRYADCLALALKTAATLPPSVSAVDFASTASSCADKAPDEPSAATVRKLVESTLSRDCQTRAPGVSLDDHADACGNLRSVRVALADNAGARQAAERALQVIEAGTRDAPAETQLIYDWERVQNLLYLGRSAEAIALLLARERALPASYNPQHYLARVYRDTKQWDAGLLAIERALGKAYGPRRIGLLGVKADLLKGAGRRDEARDQLKEQLAAYRALPAGQRQPDAEIAVQKRLLDFDAPVDANGNVIPLWARPGPMPAGGDWNGKYDSERFGPLDVTVKGAEAHGTLRHTGGFTELSGPIDGDLWRFSWTEHNSTNTEQRHGRGFFRYKIAPRDSTHQLKGEWGLGNKEVGSPWEAIKQGTVTAAPRD